MSRTSLRADTVIVGDDLVAVHDGVVVIEDGVIVYAGPDRGDVAVDVDLVPLDAPLRTVTGDGAQR